MSEVFEHNPGDHDDPLPGPTYLIGLLGAVLLIVIGLGITALFFNADQAEIIRKVVDRDPMELENLRSQQQALLTASPHWESYQVEDQSGVKDVTALVIPIDQAMELTVKEYAGK
jgi:hypothetical protein